MKIEDDKSKLTDKMELFCNEYLIDFNATQAAIRSKYSEKTAYSIGNENLKKPEIKKRIAELVNEQLGTTRDELKLKVLKELDIIAFANITDDINVVTNITEDDILDAEGNPTGEIDVTEYQRVEIKDTRQSKQSAAIASIKQNDKGAIEVKYHDKTKALEMLGKYGGLWEENNIIINNITIGKPPPPEDAEFPDE
jgi:phage terminase small subunit